MVSAQSTLSCFTASFVVTLAACLLAACGGSGNAGTGGSSAGSSGSSSSGSSSSASGTGGADAGAADFGKVVCMGGLSLRGTVNGMPLSSDRTDGIGGWTSQLMTPAEVYVSTSMPPTTTLLEIEWSNLIANGWSVPVTGGFVLSPEGAPLSGMEICPGAGSRVTIEADGGAVEFVLLGLTAGASCPASTPVTGEIDGCWGE